MLYQHKAVIRSLSNDLIEVIEVGVSLPNSSQLIVPFNKEALFIKNGAIEGHYKSGKHKLTTDQSSWLNGLKNLTRNGDTGNSYQIVFIRTGNVFTTLNTEEFNFTERKHKLNLRAKVNSKVNFKVSNVQTFISKFYSESEEQIESVITASINSAFKQEVLVKLNSYPLGEISRGIKPLEKSLQGELQKKLSHLGITLLALTDINILIEKEDISKIQALQLDNMKFKQINNHALKFREKAYGNLNNAAFAEIITGTQIQPPFLPNQAQTSQFATTTPAQRRMQEEFANSMPMSYSDQLQSTPFFENKGETDD